MHYEVTPSLKVGQRLNATQRTSSFFQETPRVCGVLLRRGQVLKLTEEQFEANKISLKRLFDSCSIEIFTCRNGKRYDFRDPKDKKALQWEVYKEIWGEEEAPQEVHAPEAQKVVEAPVVVPAEPVTQEPVATPVATAPVPEAPALDTIPGSIPDSSPVAEEAHRKGRKGRH